MDSKELYADVVRHYQSCRLDMSNISDTWDHTLNQKGTIHSYDEMMRMFVAGNRVNSWIDDCVYLIDQSILNSTDPIIRELMSLGESDFGCPTKDILFEGRRYSSNFVHTVIQAAPIIGRLLQKQASPPRILEIGGGVGLLQYLLIGYFKGNLTYYACDIPETLIIQEWYVRNCFQQVPTFFTGGTGLDIDYTASGVHFINAYVLKELSFKFDCAVNIDSMQEMYASTVRDYIRFIEENISDNGFFFFQNHYGHSAHGVSEASEYELGPNWRLHSVEYSPQIMNCDESEQLRAIFDRTAQKIDPAKRREALRLLWSGFVSNHIQTGSAETEQIIDFANSGNTTPGKQTAELLLNCNKSFYSALEPSSNSPVPIKAPFWKSSAQSWPLSNKAVPTYQYFDQCIRTLQCKLLDLLGSMPGLTEKDICSSREHIRNDLKEAISHSSLSDYWIAYFAGIFFALGDSSFALSILDQAIGEKSSPYWKIRLAQLCSRFGEDKKTAELLKNLEDDKGLDFYNKLQICELTFLHMERKSALDLLEKLFSKAIGDSAKIFSFARTSGLLGRYDMMQEGIGLIVEGEGLSNRILDLLLSFSNVREIKGYSDRLLEKNYGLRSLQAQILQMLLKRAPDAGSAVKLLLEKDQSADYYALASVGRLLLREGMREEAEFCFRKSVLLRPKAFLHLEFIGNTYFAQAEYYLAAEYLRKAIEIKTYLRHIWARYLYSCLPQKYQLNNLSFAPQDLEILFQRKQDFYHQRGPSSK